jgi:NAD(P) transhydrogenase subunit beta
MRAGIELAYLAAAVLFIVGLRRLSHPATARRGNALSAFGMLIAIAATLLDRQIVSFPLIAVGVAAGAALGLWMARAVAMTSMPQMVGLLNGFGGGASLLVATGEWHRLVGPTPLPVDVAVTIYASVLIGAVTFSGSAIAAGKLQEWISGRPVRFRGQHAVNLFLALAILGLGVALTLGPDRPPMFVALIAVSLVLGVLLVIPIGGADMPVVICLLNSYSGLAAASTGFVIRNHGLIITGALVGASGIILTQIMCKAMNRSLANVLFGGFGATAIAAGSAERATALAARGVRRIGAEDAAMLLAYARNVIVVPGYGLAVSQAQHQVRELADLLEKKGATVKYAIHPVAGRMPGHMNVLLAEANVPYDKLFDMDHINPEFERSDVALVIGANDVVNPAARNDPQSPLWGMPILDVDKSQNVIVMKRSMNPGFAGVENELFYDRKTAMLFGNAKDSLQQLITEVKAL